MTFEVVDGLEGFARLVRRTPTLDGAVPVRVAQGCVPLLEGNAFGWQIVLSNTVSIRRRLGRLTVQPPDLKHVFNAGLGRLTGQGFMTPRIEKLAWVDGAVKLFTGLEVRPAGGLALRLASCANRRNRQYSIRETWLRHDGWTPLVLEIQPDADEVRLQGEVACLSVHPAETAIRMLNLSDAPALGESHARFYDPRYFETKKGVVTGKYRKTVSLAKTPRDRGAGDMQIVSIVPTRWDVEPHRAVFRNAVSFSADYDGHSLVVEPDRKLLAEQAAAIDAAWERVYGAHAVERDRRALWYLTKYFTPHPPGEPHFFVKPWAFVSTQPGWSTLVEGLHGKGYDVMRGIVATDQFHATPAVFAMHGSGVRIQVPAGTPLMALYPIPRWLLSAEYRIVSLA